MVKSKFFPELKSRDQPLVVFHKGDEKKFSFRRRKNWLYQLALQITMVNKRTGRKILYGSDVGRYAKADYAYSKGHPYFDYQLMFNEAIDSAYKKVSGEPSDYDPEIKKSWTVYKVHKTYVQLRRYVKPDMVGGKPSIPSRFKDVVFMVPKKPVSKKKKLQRLSAKKQARQKYRKEYNQRPEVKLANKLRKQAARKKNK